MQAQRIEDRLRAMGARFDAEVLQHTRGIYRPLVNLEPSGPEQVDVAYGPADRHRLDVYQAATAPRAVVVFVHGGGFVAGDKNGDGVFYANVGRWLAREGFTAVLPNYRLAPADTWPSGARDIDSVMAWVRQHLMLNEAGMVPVVLWGQSAGASHLATWLFDARCRGPLSLSGLCGVLMMSGYYDVRAPLSAGPAAYFGVDADLHGDRSPLQRVAQLEVPVGLTVAELDPPDMARQTYALAETLTRVLGRSPWFTYLSGHNHVSPVQSLGSPHTSAAEAVQRFLGGVLKKGL